MESKGSEHILKCRDDELVRFEFSYDEFGTPYTRIIDVNDDLARLMPWGLAADNDRLYRWLSTRALPHNRRFAEKLCRSMGFSIDDMEGLYSVSCGLSLNDSYWTPSVSDDRPFSDVNLYENGFSAVLSAVAYTGISPKGGSPRGFSPELTTDGSLHKAWRIGEDGDRILYKGASNGWDPGEPMSEAVTSFIAWKAGLDAVTYGLDEWHDELCSTCACFCDRDVSYAPFAVATGISDLGAALAFCSRLGAETFESFRDMLVLDCLTLNTDRHFTNFGIMRDVSTGNPLGLAPIFDNGRGLLPMVPTEALSESQSEISTLAPSFGGRSFDQLATCIMGPRQHEWLLKIEDIDLAELISQFDGTKFKETVESRCSNLDGIIHGRVEKLLQVAPISHDEMQSKLTDAWEAKKGHREGENLCPAEPLLIEGNPRNRTRTIKS